MAISLNVDLSQTAPWDAGRGPVNDPEPGIYEVTTVEVAPHKQTVKFVVKGTFGTLDVYIPSNMEKESNRRKMLTALLSHGAKEAAIKAAGSKLTISDPMFVNRKALVLVTAVEGVDEQGRKKLNDKEFITAEQAAAWKKAQGAVNAMPSAAQAAASANGAAGAPAASAEAAMADLFGGQ